MEDYKKKYEEALERAKFYCGRGKNLEFDASDIASDIFPELKESEDEKIRKEILSFLKEFEYDHYRNLDFSSWIAWFEKQGEQNPAWSEEDKEKIELLIAIFEVNYPNEYFKVNPINTLNMEAMSTEEIVDWLKSLKERMKGE